MDRRRFIKDVSLYSVSAFLTSRIGIGEEGKESSFARKIKPVGRILELDGYYVWCNSPIMDEQGKIHVFFSRWKSSKGMGGWLNGSEIAHAIADGPEGPYTVLETVLQPRPGMWDATTCHNPLIKKIANRYYLYYMGNSNAKTNTKRIGLATADSLNGPWKRMDQPILPPGPEGAWDDHCTTNPALVEKNGKFWLYYKSWNTKEYETGTGPVKGNRKYGLAIASAPEGPYVKYKGNPVIDFSGRGNNTQFEDAFVWKEKKEIRMIARDMGIFNHENGIIMESGNGIKWSEPKIAYYSADKYIQQPPAPSHLKKYGRFERPQILFIKGKPAYLFTTSQGGKYMTSSPFIFKIGHSG